MSPELPEASLAARRTAVKTVLYRVLMVAVSIAVAFLVTGRVDQALGIGLATNGLKTVTYYCYDRLWARVEWGRSQPRARTEEPAGRRTRRQS